MKHATITTPRVTGEGGAYMLTRGEHRVQQINGRVFVVGRGKATEFDGKMALREACAYRDLLRGREAEAKATERAWQAEAREKEGKGAEARADAAGVGVGARVSFEITPGVRTIGTVAEIGPRSLAIDAADGTRYRRAIADVRPEPQGDPES